MIAIADGDTLTALCDVKGTYTKTKVRIAAIDAPERGQAFGRASKKALANLCYKQHAYIQQIDTDKYGRTVANVVCKKQDAGQYMVANGMAWVYDRHAKHHQFLYKYEHRARVARLGLWSDNRAAIAPWHWRKYRRKNK